MFPGIGGDVDTETGCARCILYGWKYNFTFNCVKNTHNHSTPYVIAYTWYCVCSTPTFFSCTCTCVYMLLFHHDMTVSCQPGHWHSVPLSWVLWSPVSWECIFVDFRIFLFEFFVFFCNFQPRRLSNHTVRQVSQ